MAGDAAHALQDEDRVIETYWDKFGLDTYAVGEAARRGEDGYFWVIGRVDDALNVAGHRMSTAEIESAIVSQEKVAGAAVIGQTDEDSGQSVTAFVTLGSNQGNGDDQLISDIREHVAKRIGRLARPKLIIWADDLPQTRSGKIMRRLLRDIAGGASSATRRRCATPTSCSSSRRRSPSVRARTRNRGPACLQFSSDIATLQAH